MTRLKPASLTVFMYHDVVEIGAPIDDAHRPYAITTDQFRRQLQALARAGITGTRLDRHLDPGAETPGRACVMTFDDGHASNCTHALPILVEAGFRATFFITAGWVGSAPYMTWDQIRSLAQAGMEIGSHSMTHRPPALLTAAELDSEMRDSKKLLEDRLGQAVVTASSPTGFFNPGMIPAARAAGYRALCYGRIGVWDGRAAQAAIPRIPVKPGDDAARVLRMATGDRLLIGSMRARQVVRNGLKRGLGVDRYLRLRRSLLSFLRPPS
ncbi:MAG TPA: polysaccharide deacetylase family protein [Candidatus Polarisedimenticolia bacterium]|nr:polysaccharide deacetylase family protein [Candidatus Polarisedimenticolia bacterium]